MRSRFTYTRETPVIENACSSPCSAIVSPLTGSSDVAFIAKVNVADLTAGYSDQLAVDITDEFSGVEAIELYRCQRSGLQFFYPAITGSVAFYESLQRHPWYYLETKPEYEFARKFISGRDAVLEVGCGRGEFGKKITVRSYLGLEFNSRAQEMAAADGLRVALEPVETHCLHHEQQYDVVCAFQVLEHVADPLRFIEACIRCLRPGGLLIYSVPNADSFLAYAENAVLNMPPHHVTWWVRPALQYVASRFGLEIHKIDCERLADDHVVQYASLLIRETLLDCIGKNEKRSLINRSLYFKIINKLAVTLSGPLARVLEDVDLRPIGHSITVVFGKSAAEGATRPFGGEE